MIDLPDLLANVMAQKWEVTGVEKGDCGTVIVTVLGQSRDPLGVAAIPESMKLDTLIRNLGTIRAELMRLP